MGTACANGNPSSTKEEHIATQQIDQELNIFENSDQRIYKLLLLGPGESGKSTLLKQMRKINGMEFKKDEFIQIKPLICKSIHESILILCNNSKNLHQMGKNTRPSDPTILDYMDKIINLETQIEDQINLDKTTLKIYQEIWKNSEIRKTYFDHNHEYQISENTDYILDRMHKYAEENYIPDFDDLIYFRKRTTGIQKIIFETKDKEKMIIYDAGGQRNERRKWYNLFDNVSCVLFVVALSSFNQNLWEDNRVNRLAEGLNLFEDVVNREEFDKAHIIMFLNKKDIFLKKIERFKVSQYFEDFTGKEHDADDIVKWIKSKFKAQCRDKEKTIFFHITQATDQNNVKIMFQSVRKIVLKNNFQDVGFL